MFSCCYVFTWYVESKINPRFFFGIFSFLSSSENCFHLKKNPPQAQSEKYSVGDSWFRQIRKLRITILLFRNYQTLSVPNGAELNLTKTIYLSSPFVLFFFSFFFFPSFRSFEHSRANFSSDRLSVSRRKLLSIACLGN